MSNVGSGKCCDRDRESGKYHEKWREAGKMRQNSPEGARFRQNSTECAKMCQNSQKLASNHETAVHNDSHHGLTTKSTHKVDYSAYFRDWDGCQQKRMGASLRQPGKTRRSMPKRPAFGGASTKESRTAVGAVGASSGHRVEIFHSCPADLATYDHHIAEIKMAVETNPLFSVTSMGVGQVTRNQVTTKVLRFTVPTAMTAELAFSTFSGKKTVVGPLRDSIMEWQARPYERSALAKISVVMKKATLHPNGHVDSLAMCRDVGVSWKVAREEFRHQYGEVYHIVYAHEDNQTGGGSDMGAAYG